MITGSVTEDIYVPILLHVRKWIDLTVEEEDYFISLLRIARVRKRQFAVQPDFVCRYRSFVVRGALRSYLIGADGKQHTVYLAVEGWWISDFNSYINQVPASLFVEAIEDSILIQIEYHAEQLLLKKIPKFERLFRILAERAFNASQQRLLSNLSMTAEERYLCYLEKYPSIAARIPQYMLASYLGFSTEFLSKIRKRLTAFTS